MPKKKTFVEKVVEKPKDSTVENLKARQAELLGLLDTMNTNGFRSVGNIEAALSVVNKDLETYA